MAELTSLTIAQARQGLAKKDFTAVELADAHLAAMERARMLNAFVLETPERALAMAVTRTSPKATWGRWRVFHSRSRTSLPPKMSAQRRAAESLAISRHLMNRQ